MTDTPPPPPQDDQTPAVVLQEPAREAPAPDWREGFTLRPEEPGVPGLHPGWAGVLAAEEVPLWQGKPDAQARAGQPPLRMLLIGGAFVFIALNMGFGGEGVPVLGFAVIGFFLLRGLLRRGPQVSDRVYLLTNRAAYLARNRGAGLADVVAYPITPALPLGLGPRAVVFATRRNAKGKEEAEGFLDIADAAAVHSMIRDLQKGQS